jgi:hypothetical protein
VTRVICTRKQKVIASSQLRAIIPTLIWFTRILVKPKSTKTAIIAVLLNYLSTVVGRAIVDRN